MSPLECCCCSQSLSSRSSYYCLTRTQHSLILEQGNYIKSKHLTQRCFGIQQNTDSVSQNATFCLIRNSATLPGLTTLRLTFCWAGYRFRVFQCIPTYLCFGRFQPKATHPKRITGPQKQTKCDEAADGVVEFRNFAGDLQHKWRSVTLKRVTLGLAQV